MKHPTKILFKILSFVEESPLSFPLWITTFLTLIFTRLFIENWLGNFEYRDPQFLFNEFTHTFLFFLLSYLLFLPLLHYFSRTSIKASANILLWGFLIILTPPLIDNIISGGGGFWSFYEFDGLQGLLVRFFTFFGENPEIGITYGVRIEVALSILLFFSYILLKTKDLLRSFFAAFLSYVLFFVLGTFPSWITIFFLGWTQGFFSIRDTDIAGLFLSPLSTQSYTPMAIMNALNAKMSLMYILILVLYIFLLSFFYYKKTTLALLRNARPVQIIYHGGLVCLGGALALLFSPQSVSYPTLFNISSFFILLIASLFAWFSSVIVNDLFDQKTDALTNTDRPLITKALTLQNYQIFGIVFFFSSLLLVTIAYPYLLFLFLIYFSLTWIYNAPPLRIKRLPFLATFVSALASLTLLFSGYFAIDKTASLEHLPWEIIALLLFTYTVSLPLKDFKDIQGDKKNDTWTLPVLLGEYNARLLIASGVFFSFLLSVLVFNIYSLVPWALFFGGISFWTIAFSSIPFQKKPLSARHLPAIILFLVFLYGLILTSQIL